MNLISWDEVIPNLPPKGWNPGARRRAILRALVEAVLGAVILLVAGYVLVVYGASLEGAGT